MNNYQVDVISRKDNQVVASYTITAKSEGQAIREALSGYSSAYFYARANRI